MQNVKLHRHQDTEKDLSADRQKHIARHKQQPGEEERKEKLQRSQQHNHNDTMCPIIILFGFF